jgi:hypothetical protein
MLNVLVYTYKHTVPLNTYLGYAKNRTLQNTYLQMSGSLPNMVKI